MPVDKTKEIKTAEEKSVDLFFDRLVEILLMQVEQEAIAQSSIQTTTL